MLLHELDAIPLYHRDPDVKRKAGAFTWELNKRLRTPQDVDLLLLAERVRIKFWRHPVTDAPPDSQHLEAARSLRDRGVPVKMVVYKGFGHGITKPRSNRAAPPSLRSPPWA